MPSYYSALDAFDRLFIPTSPLGRVVVVSDKQLKEWKQEKTLEEIHQLEELIEGHRTSISQLEKTIKILKDEIPNIETSNDKEDTNQAGS